MYNSLLKKKGPKAFIFGLDGVPYSLLKDYIENGYLPNLKGILESDFELNQMDASIPDVSSTSWTTFMTGVNPGEHGIYGFMELSPNTYKISFPNSKDVHAPTLWEILGNTANGKHSTLLERYKGRLRREYRSIVLNIPQTYPANPMNGVLTAGFVALDLKKATYPESAYQYLSSIGYVIDVDSQKARDQKDIFIKELFHALERRITAIKHFMENEPWDLFIGTVTETDRLHHFFFDAANDPDHPYHESFISFYKKVDKAIGEIFEKFMDLTGNKGFFMTMSDHGFTKLEQEVYLNNWLRERGFLKINNDREFFEKIDIGSSAFALDPARIYINTEKRFPLGAVKESDKESVIVDLKDAIRSMKDEEGNPVIREIYISSELYSGPFVDKGPDLVCLPNDGFDLKGSLKKECVFGKEHFTGMHTRYDAHCLLQKKINKPQRLHIENLAGIVLDYFLNND